MDKNKGLNMSDIRRIEKDKVKESDKVVYEKENTKGFTEKNEKKENVAYDQLTDVGGVKKIYSEDLDEYDLDEGDDIILSDEGDTDEYDFDDPFINDEF